MERGNPYLASKRVKLLHLTTGKCLNDMDSKKLLEYFEFGVISTFEMKDLLIRLLS